MPCIIVTGHPSAGKTTVSKSLRDRALKHEAIDEVILLNEESECGCSQEDNKPPSATKQTCYETALSEKETRGTLKSAFDRAVGATTMSPQQRKRRLIILDSLNYIKGFRYELHCISKAAGETHGVLWVLNKPEVVEEWNKKLQENGQGYSPELLQELILRYEPPDERNRWDKPLFTVDVAPQSKADATKSQVEGASSQGTNANEIGAATTATSRSEVLQKSVYNMHALGDVLGTGDTTISTGANNSTSTTNKELAPASQPTPKPTKSAFKRAPQKSAFQRKEKQKSQEQHAFTPDDLKALEMKEAPGEAAVEASTSQPTSQQSSSINNVAPASLEEQLDQILNVFLLQTKALKEGISTRQHVAGQANVLQNLDWITAQLISTIAATAASIVNSGKLSLTFHGSHDQVVLLSMHCTRQVALPELRRLRKMYLQWVANHPPADTSEMGIAQSFVDYVEDHLR